jgi:hypothetical protein
MKYRLFSLSIPVAALSLLAISAAQADEPKQHIDVGHLPQQATVVEDVIVPVPSEVFGVLDKLGSPNWHDVLRTERPGVPSARAETALLLCCSET